MVLVNSEWGSWVRWMFGDVNIYEGVDESIEGLGCKVTPMVWLCDVEPSRRLKVWGTAEDNCMTLVCLRRLRQAIPVGFSYRRVRLEHRDCGGLSDAMRWMHVYHGYGEEVSWDFEAVAGRDLRSVVDPKVTGYPCPAPWAAPVGKPKVTPIRPNTFHGGGLYPSSAVAPRFVVPSVFSKTGWIQRQLAGAEMCGIYDILPEVAENLTSKEVAGLTKENVLPGRVAAKMLDLYCTKLLPLFNKTCPVSERNLKRKKLESTVNAEERVQMEPTTHSVMSMEAARKQKATKADDADVPEYLWDAVLVPDGGQLKVSKLGALRTFGLRGAKRNLLRCFIKWFYGRYPHVVKWKRQNAHLAVTGWIKGFINVLKKSKEAWRDWTAGRDCIHRFSESSWWE